jgi:hypothetical protein
VVDCSDVLWKITDPCLDPGPDPEPPPQPAPIDRHGDAHGRGHSGAEGGRGHDPEHDAGYATPGSDTGATEYSWDEPEAADAPGDDHETAAPDPTVPSPAPPPASSPEPPAAAPPIRHYDEPAAGGDPHPGRGNGRGHGHGHGHGHGQKIESDDGPDSAALPAIVLLAVGGTALPRVIGRRRRR